MILVGSGNSALSPGFSATISSKIPTNTGTMKATTTTITMIANVKTSAG